MATSETPDAQVSARPSAVLMGLTYAFGAVGIFLGFWTVQSKTPSLTIAVLVAVGGAGLLSFIRHSVFDRSDAVRMGWTSGKRNPFQIEVGLANLAWAMLALAAVVFGWGIRAEAAAFLVFGFYMVSVEVMILRLQGGPDKRPWGVVIGGSLFGLAMCAIGFMGMFAN